MKIISKAIELSRKQYFETHLFLINPLLPVQLTPMEIKVLSRFMSLEGDIAKERFGTTARKIVREELNLKFAGLSNYLNSLKEKEIIKEIDKNFVILPKLIPDENCQGYQFKLVNKG